MSEAPPSPGHRRRWLVFLPVALFGALAVLFLVQLLSGREASTVPSALIGQAAPSDILPPLDGSNLPGLDTKNFAGKVSLVNVWGSWCAPCREEHPLLLELGNDDRIQLVGLNYKDKPEAARNFLRTLGNPFDAIGVDPTGRAAIDWGVYGVPETFLINKNGRIIWKQVGPFTADTIRSELLPRVQQALDAP